MLEALIGLGIGGAVQGVTNYFGNRAAAQANTKAANLMDARFRDSMALQRPYVEAGQRSFDVYNAATGANGREAQEAYYRDFQTDPGFTAAQNFGQDQISARAAAQGQTLSGNVMAALQEYGQKGMLDAYYRRLDDLYRSANLGASVGNSLVSSATSSAATQGNFMANAGRYEGSAIATAGRDAANTVTGLNNYYYGRA